MADEQDFRTEASPTLQQLVDYFVDSLFDPKNLKRLEQAVTNANAKADVLANAVMTAVADPLIEKLATFFFGLEKHIEVAAGPPLARLAGHLIGQDVSVSELRRSAATGGESALGRAVARFALNALGGSEGDLQPGQAGAERLLTLLTQLVVNGWFEGTAFELITTIFPDMDSFESVAKLPEQLVNALGLSRLSRIALRPLAQVHIATPLEWQLHKQYRPTLLGPSAVVRQWTRGRWDWADVVEELARQGYTDERIDALINEQRKFLSFGDVVFLVRQRTWTREQAVTYLEAQGIETQTASDMLTAAEDQKVVGYYDDQLAAIRRAYVNREITDAQRDGYLSTFLKDDKERTAVELAMETARALNQRFLSPSEAEAAVHAGILAVADYRAVLRREGYVEEAIDVLELLLRSKIDKETSIEDQRRALEERRALEQAAREAARKERIAALEAERALQRRGSLAELTRAAARGLIPLARVKEILDPQYDADTVSIILATIEDTRQDALAAAERRTDAEKRATLRDVSIGALDQAVFENVLTVEDVRRRLAAAGVSPEDIGVLTGTLAVRKRDLDAARAKRRQADTAAKVRDVDLSRFEQLVRRGHRTLAQYDQLLASLQFDEASRAAIVELLGLKIADDAAAHDARADTAAATPDVGLTLEELRRAVVLGLESIDSFQAWLVQQGFSADKQTLLMAELREDLAAADAARRARTQRDAPPDARSLPLAVVARAARLGVIAPATYEARLRRAGFTDDDVAIDLDLLLTEISDAQSARARADQVDATPAPSGLSLAEVAAAVKAGVQPLDVYRARAIERGLGAADVATLVRVLADELEATRAAKVRRAEIAGELQTKAFSLAALEDQVRSGALTLDAYRQALRAQGYTHEDAELLASLLADEVGASER